MIRRSLFPLLAGLLLFLAAPVVAQEPDFPRFSAPIVDQADVVPDDVEREVNTALIDYEDRSGNQIAVAVIETTGNASLEDYSIDLAREWGVGTKDEDNGVLLLVAFEDRRLRIEVGRRLEDELTDLESGRIIREQITPRLRDGDIGAAIQAGTNAIRAALGDTEAGPVEEPVSDEPQNRFPTGALWIIPFLLFGGLGAFRRMGRRGRGWGMAPIFWGGGWGSSGGGTVGGGFGGGGGGNFGGGGASGSW